MYPTLSVGFSNPLKKSTSFFGDPPQGLAAPVLPAQGYRNHDNFIIHESMPSFGLSFGVIQVACTKIVRGTWRLSEPCIVVAYSEVGDIQLAITGYGDAISPLIGMQGAAPVPLRTNFFFVNAGVHRMYYFAVSWGMMGTLARDMPALYRLGLEPDYRAGDHWQYYDVTKDEFDILRSVHTTDLQWIKRHQFLLQQFIRLMQRYHERIDRYGDNPKERTRSPFLSALDYIRDNYRNPDLNYRMIAEAVFLTESALGKTFQRQAFKSVQYINAHRVYCGADLLRSTDLPIDEVAFRSGFKHRIRFTELFKEKFGVSPTQYRNKLVISKNLKK